MSVGQDGFLGKPKAKWTPTRDAYLVELLIEQHDNGRMTYNEFKKEVVKYITWEFNKKFGMNLEDNQIKNRYNVMKKDYGVVKTLLSHKEFAWDETRHMVVADEKVWDSYIMARCEARPFRHKSFPLYEQMPIIFEGEKGFPKGQNPSGAMVTAEEVNSNSIVCINDVPTKKHKFVNPTESIRKKRSLLKIDESIEKTLYEVFPAAKTKAKLRNASNSTMYKNCLEELQKLEELDDNEFAKAVNALKDDKNAIAFMTINGPRRLTWLRSLWHSE